MAKKLYEEASVQAIANAIRAKNGSTATYKVAQMADAVLAIAPLQPDVEEYPQMSTTVAAYAEQRRAYLQKHKRVSEYDSENLMYSVIQEVLSEEAYSAIGCAVHVSLATLVKDYEPLTEEECKYARNPLTHVDFLLFNQMDKQPVLTIEVDGTGFHEVGSKQAERDIKKNSILEKCAVPLLRLRTDGSGEKEKIKDMLKTAPQK